METFKYLYFLIRNVFLKNELIQIEELKNEVFQLQDRLNNLSNDKARETCAQREKISVLTKQLDELEESFEEKKLEYFWNNKIKPSTMIYYAARSRGRNMNVLRFLNEKNSNLITQTGETYDVIANNCLKWVHNNITYSLKSDKEAGGEYWKYAEETMNDTYGDCEDGAILLANMMMANGIPSFRLRVCVGPVKGGYHAYTQYLRQEDNQWYILDWCYWYNNSVNYGLTWSRAENKYFSIDWSFNKDYGFRKSNLKSLDR